MYTDLPKEIIEAIQYEIGRNNLDFADNYRAYRCRDCYGFEDYHNSVDEGCCGFFDSNYIDSKGDKWVIGCNYGH